jgi:hypothetical protein
MNPRLVPLFVRIIRLVLGGLRDGYMAEGFTCDPKELARAVQIIAADMDTCPYEATIILLESGDLVVVNHHILITKLESSDYYIPMIIDVRGVEPCKLSKDTSRLVLQRISDCLFESIGELAMAASAPGHAACRVMRARLDSEIGLVLLAGWLLGYPYLYYYVSAPTDRSSLGCSALAMQALIKHSVAATCLDGAQTPVQEFSVPACIFDDHEESSVLFHREDAKSISNAMKSHLSRLSGQSKSPRDSAAAMSFQAEIVTLPHVIL